MTGLDQNPTKNVIPNKWAYKMSKNILLFIQSFSISAYPPLRVMEAEPISAVLPQVSS